VTIWEVKLDPISDSFDPEEIDADSLLRRWAKRVGPEHPDGLVPIYWFVDSPGHSKFERMPFQAHHQLPTGEVIPDFLSCYTWPENPNTGERLNWLSLPVEDKLWRKGRADKGGFIQEATGWKPSLLQPFVYLPALLAGRL